jgi:hypothetical protein
MGSSYIDVNEGDNLMMMFKLPEFKFPWYIKWPAAIAVVALAVYFQLM